MEISLIDHWQVVVFIAALLFNAGMTYKMLKDKPSIKDVDKMIEKKFANHCPFADKIDRLETVQAKNVEDVSKVVTKIHQIDFNVQNICKNLGVDYIGKSNGGT